MPSSHRSLLTPHRARIGLALGLAATFIVALVGRTPTNLLAWIGTPFGILAAFLTGSAIWILVFGDDSDARNSNTKLGFRLALCVCSLALTLTTIFLAIGLNSKEVWTAPYMAIVIVAFLMVHFELGPEATWST